MEPGQTSSLEDFRELGTALQGLWIGGLTLKVDWTGGREGGFLGKKGEEITIHGDLRVTPDGSALLGTFYSGNGAVTALYAYDPVAKQIKGLEAYTGGTLWDIVFYKKKDGSWQKDGTGSHSDGTKNECRATFTFSDDGDTYAGLATFTSEGKESTQVEVTYRRVGK